MLALLFMKAFETDYGSTLQQNASKHTCYHTSTTISMIDFFALRANVPHVGIS
jgi:hypothetical protein